MPINPSILFQAQQPEAPDVLGAVSQAFALKNQKMQIDAAKEAKNNKDLLGQLFAKHTKDENGKQSVDSDAVLSDLFSMGKADLALQYDEDRTKLETEKAQHEKALKDNDISALKLEGERTTQLSNLARGALELENLPEPLKQQGWQNFVAKASQIDPDLKGKVPEQYDPNWLRMGVEAGMSAEDSIKNRLSKVQTDATQAMNADLPNWSAKMQKVGRDQAKLSALKADFLAKHGNAPDAIKTADSIFKLDVAPSVALMTAASLTPSFQDDWAARLSNGTATPQQLYSSIPSRATNRAEVINNILKKAEALNPNFNFAQAAIQVKQADNVGNQRQIASANNFLSNVDHLIDLSDKTSKTGMPGLNAALQSAQFKFGDKNVTSFREAQMAVAEELARVLGGNSPSMSDFRLKYGESMVDGNLGYEQFKAAMKEAKRLAMNAKATTAKTMGVYAPLGEGKGQSEGNPIEMNSAEEAQALPPNTYFTLDGVTYKTKPQ